MLISGSVPQALKLVLVAKATPRTMKPPRKPQVRAGEVEYKQTSGTAWSHSYLNQKPWHPLSYPNQRRKWIAEQTHANQDRRKAEVAKEFAQEQEFYQQTAVLSKKQKEKVEIMQAVSFMYMRPPGYNAESARAAEIADERKKLGLLPPLPESSSHGNVSATETSAPGKKQRVRDVFGMSVATEEEFDVLKNAPRLDTGAPGRVKPFGVEIRNVKCARCGVYGHQSGDRECTMKDSIMPSDEARLARDDPLNVIRAQTSGEPLKWELKQLPGGLSPARGGFRPDDPNQQIIPTDIFDEYGGFLGGAAVPDVLTLVSSDHRKKREKHREGKTMKRRHESRHSEGDSSRKRRRTKEEVSDSSGSSDAERDGEKRLKAKKIASGGRSLAGSHERWRDSGRKGDRKGHERKQRRETSLNSSDSERTSRSDQDDEDQRCTPKPVRVKERSDYRRRKRKGEDLIHGDESRHSELSNSGDDRADRQWRRKQKRKRYQGRESSAVSSSSEDSPRHKQTRRRPVGRRGKDVHDRCPIGTFETRTTRASRMESELQSYSVEYKRGSKNAAAHAPQVEHGLTVIEEYDRWDGGECRSDSFRPHRSRDSSDVRYHASGGQGCDVRTS